MDKRINVIIDTDIGGDIDDAFALCLAMRSPEVRILGVTTVFQDTVKRARIAARLLRLGGLPKVPVAAGARCPLKNDRLYGQKIDFSESPVAYVEDYDGEEYLSDISAKDFIIKTLENTREPIAIVTLGALTNIAQVLMERPDLKERIYFISMMGGAFFCRNVSEFNFSCDPEAAELVIHSGIDIRCVGLDVTFQCMLDRENVRLLCEHQHPCIKMLMDMKKAWGHDVYLHDPLALAVTFQKDLVTLRKIACEIELEGRYTRGVSMNLSDFTWDIPADDSKFEAAFSVNSKQVVQLCMERLLSFQNKF